jgi:hypothetical protein
MPFWGWILLIAALGAFVLAAVFVIVHHTHRRMSERQAIRGGATDLSAPLPMHVRDEQALMTERELQTERERDEEREPEQPRASW